MPTTVLSNLERRAVGNLSIPRNVSDLAHVLRQDPHAPTLPEPEVAELLGDLEAAGLVTNLGEHDHLARLAAGLERHPTGVAMPDEKAMIYIDRLTHAGRAWRRRGDLWLFTEEGLAQLTAPDPGAGEYATTTEQLQRAVAREWERVLHDAVLRGSIHDENGGQLEQDVPLAESLLVEEFQHWFGLVADEHERQTGDRISPPIAGGSYSDATELLILAADTGGTAYGETSPTYFALTTVAVTDADTGSTITEATYTGYARKSIANTDFSSASAGSHTTANAITFAGATGGSSTVIGGARCVAATVGRIVRRFSITSTVVSATNTPASFAAGAYTDTLD